MSYNICVTRFTNETFNENEKWKDNINQTFYKRFYNTSVKIKLEIPELYPIIVIEMNLDTNKIIAFGLIKNICQQWRYKIYSNDFYNRYTYIAKNYIYAQELQENYAEELNILERELFYGKGHLKRGFGIQEVPEKKIKNIQYLFRNIYRILDNK